MCSIGLSLASRARLRSFIPAEAFRAFVTPDVADALERETRKWADRLDVEVPKAKALTPRGERFLENLRAYRSDATHFAAEGDLVRAFESVVWAWAWLEIASQTGDVDWTYPETARSTEGEKT